MINDRFWDKRAEKYAKSPIRDMPAYEITMERVSQYLGPEDRVLELGCGTGSTALKLAHLPKEIVATDISGKMIEIANRKIADGKIKNVSFERTERIKGDFADHSFDVVMGFNLFHLVKDPMAAFEDINRLLKPGGLFISKTPCLGGIFIYRAMILPMRALGIAPFVGFHTIQALDAMIEQSGFEIVETGNYPQKPPSHFVVARKPV